MLQDLVTGLDAVMFNDLMANIEWFFTLHDKDKDGSITKDEVLQLSESLLVSVRHEISRPFTKLLISTTSLFSDMKSGTVTLPPSDAS